MVVADKTKGQVFIKQSNDQLMHFCWKNRETGAVVDDLIIFPGDTEFKEVKGCPDGKVNDALNKPPTTRATARGGSSERTTGGLSTANLAGLSGSEELGALGGLDQQQLMQLLQFMNQAANTFGHALSTGQMAPVLERFGISEGAAQAAATGNLLEFARKLTEAERGLEASQPANEPAASASVETAVEMQDEDAEEPVKEPEPKRGKTEEDEMDLD
ncbi:hypothetical protein OSTOST_03987 [Ostertagia ostertagi]